MYIRICTYMYVKTSYIYIYIYRYPKPDKFLKMGQSIVSLARAAFSFSSVGSSLALRQAVAWPSTHWAWWVSWPVPLRATHTSREPRKRRNWTLLQGVGGREKKRLGGARAAWPKMAPRVFRYWSSGLTLDPLSVMSRLASTTASHSHLQGAQEAFPNVVGGFLAPNGELWCHRECVSGSAALSPKKLKIGETVGLGKIGCTRVALREDIDIRVKEKRLGSSLRLGLDSTRSI